MSAKTAVLPDRKITRDDIEAKLQELRSAIGLARLFKTERREEARRTLSEVYGWFTEGFDLRDLIEAKALLEELRS